MSHLNKHSAAFITHQLQTQRQNFISVCRLAVKSLTDQTSYGNVEEGSKDLDNFLAILEHILNHRLKPSSTWYGGQEPRFFWDFIKPACRNVAHNCLSSVESMVWPQTSYGKGRVWIRMCLMEKRLSDYISVALQQTRLLDMYYDEGALLVSDESSILSDLLLGLNVIDFSFDLKGTYLDYSWTPAIDFTPYLKYDRLLEGSYPEIKSSSNDMDNNDDEQKVELLKTTCGKLKDQLRTTTEQKNYLDELLRLREFQLEEAHTECQRRVEFVQLMEQERQKDKVQFESIIFELQSQLFHMKEENKGYMKKVQLLTRQNQPTSPVISMSDLIARASDNDAVFPESDSKPIASAEQPPVSEPACATADPFDGQSMCSETTSISVPASGREDTVSTLVLAGSLTNESVQEVASSLPDIPPNPKSHSPSSEQTTAAEVGQEVSRKEKDLE